MKKERKLLLRKREKLRGVGCRSRIFKDLQEKHDQGKKKKKSFDCDPRARRQGKKLGAFEAFLIGLVKKEKALLSLSPVASWEHFCLFLCVFERRLHVSRHSSETSRKFSFFSLLSRKSSLRGNFLFFFFLSLLQPLSLFFASFFLLLSFLSSYRFEVLSVFPSPCCPPVDGYVNLPLQRILLEEIAEAVGEERAERRQDETKRLHPLPRRHPLLSLRDFCNLLACSSVSFFLPEREQGHLAAGQQPSASMGGSRLSLWGLFFCSASSSLSSMRTEGFPPCMQTRRLSPRELRFKLT